MKMNSVMKHNFSEVPKANIQRSVFNRSHGYKTMFDGGKLVPYIIDEVLPGDTYNVKATLFLRMANALQVPIMDNMYMDTFYFFVPTRIIWDNFQKFMGEQDSPGDSTDFTVPVQEAPVGTGYIAESLADYFAIPTDIPELEVNTLPFRAYNLCYQEWFRDENLQDAVVLDKDDGPDDPADYTVLTRGKRHDYFTSCLPFPQKGDAVPLPLAGDAPITGIGASTQNYADGPVATIYETGGGATTSYTNAFLFRTTGDNKYVEEDPSNAGYPNIYANLAAAQGPNINELREAFQLQILLERDARGGTRYTEIIRSHFNVTSPDGRLQRPEFLGGNSTPIMVNPVQQTGETGTTPQGNLAAYATAASGNEGFTKSFTEHGYIIGIVNVRTDLTYQQGLDRMWSRSTKYDFYWPALAHLGEQEVLNKEIYAQNDANDDLVFGYQERFAEYRYKQSHITGKLRSTYTTPLDYWHLSEEFSSLPTLSATFIESPAGSVIDRISAVPAEPQFVFDSFINMKTVRPMPTYGVPGLIDHF
jgi:hypothetical protein